MSEDITITHAETDTEMRKLVDAQVQKAFEYLKSYEGYHCAFVFAAMECDEDGTPSKVKAFVGGSEDDVLTLTLGALKRHEDASQ